MSRHLPQAENRLITEYEIHHEIQWHQNPPQSESQTNRRYLYFANQADVEGNAEVAGLLIGDWFETLAKAARSYASERMRAVVIWSGRTESNRQL